MYLVSTSRIKCTLDNVKQHQLLIKIKAALRAQTSFNKDTNLWLMKENEAPISTTSIWRGHTKSYNPMYVNIHFGNLSFYFCVFKFYYICVSLWKRTNVFFIFSCFLSLLCLYRMSTSFYAYWNFYFTTKVFNSLFLSVWVLNFLGTFMKIRWQLSNKELLTKKKDLLIILIAKRNLV